MTRIDLHEHYDQLTDAERNWVDEQFREIYAEAKRFAIPLRGDDEAEVTVDALARLIILSRRRT